MDPQVYDSKHLLTSFVRELVIPIQPQALGLNRFVSSGGTR